MKKGVKLVFGTAVISGISIFVNSLFIININPSIFTFAKNVLVSIFLFSIILLLNKFKELKSLSIKNWFYLILIGLVGGSIPFLLFFKGLQLSTGPASALIHKTIFIFSTVLAVIFLKEKINYRVISAACVLLIGNFLLLKFNVFSFKTGELFILIAVLFWAIENIISKYVLKDISFNIVVLGRMAFGSLFILIFLLITNKAHLLTSIDLSKLFIILIASLLLLLYVLTYYKGLKTINVSTATSILSLGSPITFLLNFVFLGQLISLEQFIGVILIIISVAAIAYYSEKRYVTISTA